MTFLSDIYSDIDVDFAGLKEHNEDIIGWFYFENEKSVSYPLLYSSDDYYLRRNYLKEEETAVNRKLMQCVMRAIIQLIEMEVQDGYSECH